MPIPHRSSRPLYVPFFVTIIILASLVNSGAFHLSTSAQTLISRVPIDSGKQAVSPSSGPGVCDLAGSSPIEIEAGGTTTGHSTLRLAFETINAGIRTGDIVIDVCGNTTEVDTAVLNGTGIGAANYTSLRIQPVGGARIIEGSAQLGLLKLNSADNVTIDGRLNGEATGRYLTIRNLLNNTNSVAIWLSSGLTSNGATNNTVRNLEISTGTDTTASNQASFGIFMGGANIGISTGGVDNDGNSFIANRIVKARYGIVTRGVTGNLSSNTVIADNVIGAAEFGSDQIGKTGIYAQNDTGATITGNIIQNIGCVLPQSCAAGDRFGIAIGGDDTWNIASVANVPGDNYKVTNNRINNIVEEKGGSAVGIRLGTATTNGPSTSNVVANNFISGVRANSGASKQASGIAISGGHSDRVVFNSISMTGDVDPGLATAASSFSNAIRISAANSSTHSNLTLKNNSIYLDLSSSNTAVRFYAITGTSSSYSFGSGGLDQNNYFTNPSNSQLQTGGLTVTSGASTSSQFSTLTNWRGAYATVQDANSIQVDPLFFSSSDLHIATTSPNRNGGTSMPGVTVDIDGNTRDASPDIGADEFVVPTAANVSLGGRVISSHGIYVVNALLTLEGGDLIEPRTARTNGFGYYQFEGLSAGLTYVITVKAKRYTFTVPTRVVNMDDSVDDADFIAEP